MPVYIVCSFNKYKDRIYGRYISLLRLIRSEMIVVKIKLNENKKIRRENKIFINLYLTSSYTNEKM